MQAAVDFADKSPLPKMEDMYQYMYASEVPNTISEAEREMFESRLNGGAK